MQALVGRSTGQIADQFLAKSPMHDTHVFTYIKHVSIPMAKDAYDAVDLRANNCLIALLHPDTSLSALSKAGHWPISQESLFVTT